jgi:hypothetical protein
VLWTALSASALALQIGSMGLAIYGLAHPEDEPDDDAPPPAPPPLRAPSKDAPAQLFIPLAVPL